MIASMDLGTWLMVEGALIAAIPAVVGLGALFIVAILLARAWVRFRR